MFLFSGMTDYGFGEVDVFGCHNFSASYNFNLFFYSKSKSVLNLDTFLSDIQ